MAEPTDYWGQLEEAEKNQPQAAKPQASGDYFERLRKAEAVSAFNKQMLANEAAKPKPKTNYSKAASSGAQEAALSVPGAFKDIPSGIASVVTAGTTYGVPYLAEKAGVPFSPEFKKRLETSREKVLGAVDKYNPFASTEELSKSVEPYAEKTFGVGPMYQPQTPQEAMTKQGVSLGLQSAMGKPQGVFKRMLSGAGAGAISEGLGSAIEDTDYASLAPYARLGALTTAPWLLEKFPVSQTTKIVEGALSPSAAAKRDLAAGVGSFGKKSEVTAHKMALANNVSEVAASMPDRIRQFNQDITGIMPNSAQYADLLDRVGKVERTRVFNVARANPNSNSIDISSLGTLQNHPLFKEAEDAAKTNAVNAPNFNIIPPHTIPGQPSQTLHGANGLYNSPATPAQQINGNLNFYQQVKEELDVMIKKANANQDYTKAKGAQQIKDQLINTIDPQVPKYRDALSASRLTYGMENAPEAGAQFFEKYNTFKDNDFRKSFAAYTPDEQNAFRVGFLGRLEQELGQGRDQALKLFVKNPAFQSKVEHIFGPQIAGEIRAKYLSEAMLQRAAKIDTAAASGEAVSAFEKSRQVLKPGAIAAGMVGGASEIANQAFLWGLLKQSGVSLPSAALAAIAAMVTMGGRVALNAAEKRIANKMVEFVSKNDPASYAKLNRLIDKNPEVYPKVMELLETARTSTELYGLPTKEKPASVPQETLEETYDRLVKEGKIQPARADGGRIGRASGGKVDIDRGVRALMMAVDAAKKKVNLSTESLLEQPDEHIAQALNMAKRHI
jgi:hypothetical protein